MPDPTFLNESMIGVATNPYMSKIEENPDVATLVLLIIGVFAFAIFAHYNPVPEESHKIDYPSDFSEHLRQFKLRNATNTKTYCNKHIAQRPKEEKFANVDNTRCDVCRSGGQNG